MASLFISYSRRDIEVARKLTEAFQGPGLDFWIDWEGIPPTVDWWKEIERGIETADIFLFLLSPASAASPVCRQEIEHAAKNGKRLVPVVVRTVTPEEAPPELRPLNWVYLREDDNFRAAFSKLMKAIQTDYAWVQVHRELQVKALEWARNKHKNDLLLHGEELQDAEAQLTQNASKEPQPTDLQRDYALKSRQESDRRRRRNTGIITAALLIMSVLTVVAIVQRGIALTNEAEANRQANIAISRQLAAQAQASMADHPELGLLLAIEAAQQSEKTLGAYLPITDQALRDALLQIRIPGRPFTNTDTGDGSRLTASAFSPDGRWVATASNSGKIYLWDMQNPVSQPVTFVTDAETLQDIAFSPDGKWLANTSANEIYLWDMQDSSSQPIKWETSTDFIDTLMFSPDGRWLETDSGIWDLRTLPNKPILLQSEDGSRQTVGLSPDGHWMAVSSIHEDQSAGLSLHDMRDASAEPLLLYTGTTFLSQLSFSPLGRWLAVASSDQTHTFFTWDLQDISSGPLDLEYNDVISGMTFSPDDRWFAIGSENSISIWNMQDFSSPSRTLPGDAAFMIFSNDGRWLFTSTGVWDLNDSSADPFLLGDELVDINLTGFSPDGRWLLTADSCHMHLWSTRDFDSSPIIIHGHDLRNCGGVPNGNDLTSRTFSADGHWLITTDANSNTWLWDIQNPVPEPFRLLDQSKKNEVSEISDLVFSPDGHWLVTSTELFPETSSGRLPQKEVRLWDMQNIKGEPKFLSLADNLISSPNRRWLALRRNDEDFVSLWDLQNINSGPKILPQVDMVVFSPDGHWLATLITDEDNNSIVHLGDLQNMSKEFVLLQNGESIRTLAFSPDGRWLATGTPGNQIHILDLEGSSTNWVELAHRGELVDLTFSPTGRWLATISGDNKDHVDLWDISNLSLQQIRLPSERDLLIFSSDEHWLAAGSINGYGRAGIDLIDLNNSLRKTILPNMGEDDARVFEFSPNGQWLATGSYNGTIHVWDLRNPDAVPAVIQGTRDPVDRMVFSADSKLLVAGATTGTVFLWDMHENLAEPVLVKHPNLLSTLALSPDGQWLATGGGGYPAFDNGDHDVRLWHLDLKDVLSISCKSVGRNFTRSEWAQYFPDEGFPTVQQEATCPQWPLELEQTPMPSSTP